MYVFDYID